MIYIFGCLMTILGGVSMPEIKRKIALIGECMVEFGTSSDSGIKQSYGGDSLNTAIYLSALNRDKSTQVSYVTSMGSDDLSREIIASWQQQNINTDNVLIDSKRTVGAYLIRLDEAGERSFAYWRDNSAAKYMVSHPEFHRVQSGLESMDAIYVSGISLAILPKKDCASLVSQLEQLSKLGVAIIFDSNHRPRLWESRGGEGHAQYIHKKVLSFCDLALLTDDDEKNLWGDSDYLDTLARLEKSGVNKVVLKRGKNGCVYKDFINNKMIHVGIEDDIQVVDTTSAGDSFNAGFLHGYIRGYKPEECSEIGNCLAGIVIQHRGALISKSLLESAIIKANKYE